MNNSVLVIMDKNYIGIGSINFFITILSLSVSSFVHSGNLYVYRDQAGAALLTNKKVSGGEYRQEKVTYYPKSNAQAYNNWDSSGAALSPSYSNTKNAYDHIIRNAAQMYGVSEGLIKAIMHTESGFNPSARSPVGAQGLMQLMPATAQRFNVSNAYDPVQNIHGGVKYLSWLIKRFKGNTQLALAGYNAGEGNVDKYGGIPPFKETQNYVRRVMSRYQNLYAGGVSVSPSTNANDGIQIISASSNYTPSSNQQSSQREIIALSDGNFTDRPARTYANENASVSSNIYISD